MSVSTLWTTSHALFMYISTCVKDLQLGAWIDMYNKLKFYKHT